MAKNTIEIKNYHLIRRIVRQMLQPHFDKVMSALSFAIGEELVNRLQKYPMNSSANRQKRSNAFNFVSERQRRWFFASINDGTLSVPYSRTNQLQQKWKTENKGKHDAIVGNPMPYGPFVQSDEDQTWMHKAQGFITDQQAIDEVSDSNAAQIILNRTLRHHIQGLN